MIEEEEEKVDNQKSYEELMKSDIELEEMFNIICVNNK